MGPWSVAIGRFDADDVVDLAVSRFGAGDVAVLLGE
jgi:hypothetical protein